MRRKTHPGCVPRVPSWLRPSFAPCAQVLLQPADWTLTWELIVLARDVVAEHERGRSSLRPRPGRNRLLRRRRHQRVGRRRHGRRRPRRHRRERVAVVRRDIRTDWTVREGVRAKLRTSTRRLLIEHGYPPDEQPDAIKLVMEHDGTDGARLRPAVERDFAKGPSMTQTETSTSSMSRRSSM